MKTTDSAGRNISLQLPLERIIVLNTDAAEALTILGAIDKIMGIVDTIQIETEHFPDLVPRSCG
jgi:iron complex transport system substrate-binding protein